MNRSLSLAQGRNQADRCAITDKLWSIDQNGRSKYQRCKMVTAIILSHFIVLDAVARPPAYGDGTASKTKVDYCSRLVDTYGHQSQEINSRYYGIGVQRPDQRKWSLRIKNPGWFSDDLFIIFEQTTEEKYEPYTHTAYCLWSEDAPWFEFNIEHFDVGPVTLCYQYATELEHRCP